MNAPDRLSATARPAPDAASAEPHVMQTYGRLPIALSHGRGCWLWDTDGKKYLDALGGIAVNTLGHAHPKLVPALQDQIGKLIHSSNYYLVPLQEQLAAKLCELSGLTQCVLLQHRPRGQRGGAQDRAQVRPRQGHRAPGDRRLREGLPRPLDRDAVGDRQPEDPGRLRPAGRRLRARAAERRRALENVARTQPERRRRVPRGDPGRRRHPADDGRVPARQRAGSATSAAGC